MQLFMCLQQSWKDFEGIPWWYGQRKLQYAWVSAHTAWQLLMHWDSPLRLCRVRPSYRASCHPERSCSYKVHLVWRLNRRRMYACSLATTIIKLSAVRWGGSQRYVGFIPIWTTHSRRYTSPLTRLNTLLATNSQCYCLGNFFGSWNHAWETSHEISQGLDSCFGVHWVS